MPIMLFVVWFAIFASWTDLALGADLALPSHVLPDPHFTPGRASDLTAEQICAKTYTTKSVRPPVAYTNTLKRQQLKDRGFADQNMTHYEEDHDIPLEIGGHPTDPANLSPEPWKGVCGAHIKDKLENQLHKLVCAHKLDLAQAQHDIAADWVGAYNKYVGRLVCR